MTMKMINRITLMALFIISSLTLISQTIVDTLLITDDEKTYLLTIKAIDPEGDIVSYDIDAQGSDELFTIGKLTGEITIATGHLPIIEGIEQAIKITVSDAEFTTYGTVRLLLKDGILRYSVVPHTPSGIVPL